MKSRFSKIIKQLFCCHSWRWIEGIGQFHKGNREVYRVPVMKKLCHKCGKQKIEVRN